MTERTITLSPRTLTQISHHLSESIQRHSIDLPESASEINLISSHLSHIKNQFYELSGYFESSEFSHIRESSRENIIAAVKGCARTIKDLDKIVLRTSVNRRVSHGSHTSPRSARKSWNEITSAFRNNEGVSLSQRLSFCKTMLETTNGLLECIFNRQPTKTYTDQLLYLLRQQEDSTQRRKDLESLHRAQLQTSHAQEYPSCCSPLSGPHSPQYAPTSRPYSTPLPSPPFAAPINTTAYYHIPTTIHESRPMTPISPVSPISPISPLGPSQMGHIPMGQPQGQPTTPPLMRSSAARTQNQGSWWTQVWNMVPGNTMMPEAPAESICNGEHMANLALAPEEKEIFRMRFDNDLTFRMFHNSLTQNANVVITLGGGEGSWSSRRSLHRFQTCISATKLNIVRNGPGIHFYRRQILWATLYFEDFETMTLFFHAFLALRMGAPGTQRLMEYESWMDGEELAFAGRIRAEGRGKEKEDLVLRVLRDEEFGTVRLAAAKTGGNGEDVTVWTAFVTHQLAQPGWIRRTKNEVVFLKNIQQFSFSSRFDSTLVDDFELVFADAKGM
ncbi:hypothetical protein FPQ18DRAFT_252597 [Pyronema domesticum]|nr:hypothetical protein FPQ18DRAFT_252597 [Pyronema domesticum]